MVIEFFDKYFLLSKRKHCQYLLVSIFGKIKSVVIHVFAALYIMSFPLFLFNIFFKAACKQLGYNELLFPKGQYVNPSVTKRKNKE